MPKVNPLNLRWARERAGLTLEQAAKSVFSGRKGPDRLALVEQGELEPSRAQISELAKRYHRSLVALYMSQPPRDGELNQDFRTIRDRDETQEARLDAIVRSARVRQALLQAALEETDEAQPLSFVGSVAQNSTAEQISESIKRLLDISIDDFRSKSKVDEAFGFLRDAIERRGVYVLLMGNLGSHHSNVSPSVFRGFSIAKPVAPLIVINETDSRYSWSFTLLHELAHVLLGQSDISGYYANNELERRCDDAASLFLLRPGDIEQLEVNDATPLNVLFDRLNTFAQRWKVSRLMIAYNLLRAGLISNGTYQNLAEAAEQGAERRQRRGRPDYYVVRRHRLGRALIKTVGRMVDGGALTTSKAAKVLGVKPTGLARLGSGIIVQTE